MPARLQLDDRAIVRGYKAGLTSMALAQKFGCTQPAILLRLREAGVVMRPSGKRLRQVPDPQRFDPQKLVELVDGLMLGDGSLEQQGRIRVNQRPDRIGWLRLIQRQFASIGIRASISAPRKQKRRLIEGRVVGETTHVTLTTRTYDAIQTHRRRWYPDGVKHVPTDLTLTRSVIVHWFCGDGSAVSSGRLAFYTDGFEWREAARLARCLTRYGLSAGVYAHGSKDRPCICLGAEAARRFKLEMRSSLPYCCRYKVARIAPKPERRGRPGSLSRRTVHAIRYGDSKSARYRKLLVTHKVSPSMARRIRAGRAYVGYDLGSPR